MSTVGVDGCRGGYLAAMRRDGCGRITVWPRFADLVSALPEDAVIAIDMPIGLPDEIVGGGRGPEQAVRRFLGPRQSSVFAIPARAAVEAGGGSWVDQAAAIAAHRRVSAIALAHSSPPRKVSFQAFCLFPKILEVDAALRADRGLARRVIESHPEAAFAVLNGGKPMATPKKIKGRVNPDGMDERRRLPERFGLGASLVPQKGAGADDVLDALAMLAVAERHRRGEAVAHHGPLRDDRHGLAIAIWT